MFTKGNHPTPPEKAPGPPAHGHMPEHSQTSAQPHKAGMEHAASRDEGGSGGEDCSYGS